MRRRPEIPYGGLIAPPTFLRAIRVERPALPFAVPYGRNLDGGSEWEFFEPVRIGDYITAQIEIDDIFERPGRLGTMLFTIYLTTYKNQLGPGGGDSTRDVDKVLGRQWLSRCIGKTSTKGRKFPLW